MVLTFLARRPRFCHGYLLESHSITGLDLGKKRRSALITAAIFL